MIDYKKELIEIFKNDNSAILDITPKNTTLNASQHLIEVFAQINNFYKENKREPRSGDNISERRLTTILNEIKSDFSKKKELKQYDQFNLLGEIKEIDSLEDVFENDFTNILDTSLEDQLLDIKSFDIERAKTDFVARRKPCKNFDDYKLVFKKIHSELKIKNRKIVEFKDMDLKEGNFFVLDGMVVLLEKILGKNIKNFLGKTGDVRDDPRTRCIFENGMESNMYLRSFQKLLYQNGKRISETQEEALDKFDKNLGSSNISGYIYVLKSLSNKQQIQNIPNLYKIGFSTNEVSKRIKNAKNEATYLNADVEIISETPIVGFNPNKIENILQSFFAKRKIEIEVINKNKKKIKPDEWFSVPIKVIHQAIDLLRNNTLKNYQYDEIKNTIFLKK